MRKLTLGTLNYKYPDTIVPIYGHDIFVLVTDLTATIADATISTMTLNGVTYTSQYFGGKCYFYFDNKIPTDVWNGLNYTFIHEGNTLTWKLILGTWETFRVQRQFIPVGLFAAVKNETFETGGSVYLKLISDTGVVSIVEMTGSFTTDLTNIKILYYAYLEDGDPVPTASYSGWIGEYMIHPICSRFGIRVNKSKFEWLDRYGYRHQYYFDVTSKSNVGTDKITSDKSRLGISNNVIHYSTSVAVAGETRTYISEPESFKNTLDISTLGSAMYVEIDGIPVDPSLIGSMTANGDQKGLENITFSITYAPTNKNSLL